MVWRGSGCGEPCAAGTFCVEMEDGGEMERFRSGECVGEGRGGSGMCGRVVYVEWKGGRWLIC